MKNLKLLLVLFMTSLFISTNAFAQTIGVVDYPKVLSSYNYAKEVFKTLDSKNTELQQYLFDKEKQYKNLTNPVDKKTFEDKVQREYKAKVDALTKMKDQKEQEITNSILTVVKKVATQKKIDVVVEASAVLTGGTDITNDVISGLNNK